MEAVILFSHGSLLCGAGQSLLTHAERLRARGVAPLVGVGYLNYSEPTFAEAVADVVAQGASRIVVAPYFLIPGKFVKVDLPEAIARAQAEHPNVGFVVADAIGYEARLADGLIAGAAQAVGAEGGAWRSDLTSAPRYCRVNPECPLYDTPACPRVRRGEADEGSLTVPPVVAPLADALLVMVHGSPRPVANEAMFQVVEVVRERGAFAHAGVGFMECNAPDIPTAIADLVAQGARAVTAVPYFLHTGTHVADDLPTLLEAAQQEYPKVAFRMGPYLGREVALTDILQDRIEAARAQESHPAATLTGG